MYIYDVCMYIYDVYVYICRYVCMCIYTNNKCKALSGEGRKVRVKREEDEGETKY